MDDNMKNFKPRAYQKNILEKAEKQARENLPKINELFRDHYELYKLTTTDADIYAWFKMAEQGHCTVEEALIGALVHVAKNKAHYFDELLKAKGREMPGSLIEKMGEIE